MKRDMDLIRRVLLEIEESDEWLPGAITYEEVDDELVSYHVKLLYEAGLIDAIDMSTNTLKWQARTLTWQGHEFLDSARDDTRWESAKATIFSRIGSLPFDLLKEVLSQIAKGQLAG